MIKKRFLMCLVGILSAMTTMGVAAPKAYTCQNMPGNWQVDGQIKVQIATCFYKGDAKISPFSGNHFTADLLLKLTKGGTLCQSLAKMTLKGSCIKNYIEVKDAWNGAEINLTGILTDHFAHLEGVTDNPQGVVMLDMKQK